MTRPKKSGSSSKVSKISFLVIFFSIFLFLAPESAPVEVEDVAEDGVAEHDDGGDSRGRLSRSMNLFCSIFSSFWMSELIKKFK